jgi:hypothetical protein
MLGNFHLTKWRCIGTQTAATHYFFNKAASARLITFFPGPGSGNIPPPFKVSRYSGKGTVMPAIIQIDPVDVVRDKHGYWCTRYPKLCRR